MKQAIKWVTPLLRQRVTELREATRHRSQFEALVRSVWLAYGARDSDLAKLTATLDLESEQAAKNVPTVNVMMQHIQEKAPVAAYSALARFR